MRFNFVDTREGNSFYPVEDSEILEVEDALKLNLPKELKEFYLEVGYGFIQGSKYNINRLMDPLSVRDFRLRTNDFKHYPDIEIYEEVEQERLAFFLKAMRAQLY